MIFQDLYYAFEKNFLNPLRDALSQYYMEELKMDKKEQQVYEFKVTDTYSCTIPVLASSPEEADHIYEEWESSVNGGLELDNLLDNGYLGRVALRQELKSVEVYPFDDILLPKEGNPYCVTPLYHLSIRFEDGKKDHYSFLTIDKMVSLLNQYLYGYTLFPDPLCKQKYIEICDHDGGVTSINYYAIKKEPD